MDVRVRSRIQTKFGTVGRVSLSYFIKHLFPPIPSGLDYHDVMSTLENSGKKSSRPFGKNGRWKGFVEQIPCDGDRTKTEAFKHFPAVIDAICKAGASKGFEPTSELVQDVKELASSSSDGLHPEDTLPDACFVPCDQDGPVTWDDVGAVGWYQRRNTERTRREVRRICSSTQTLPTL